MEKTARRGALTRALEGNALPALTTLLLFTLAIALRFHELGETHAFDLDEGVYWETLRAMQAGHTLYRDVFFSQPPLFLLSIYPFYSALGKSIYSARIGAAAFSLVGLCGYYMMGRVTSGRWGGPLAVSLAVSSPSYLAMSQTLQAEAPAMGFSLLSIGTAFLAFRTEVTRLSTLLWGVTGALLSIAILCKFLAIATCVPIVVLLGISLTELAKKEDGWKAVSAQVLAFSAGLSFVAGAVTLLYANELHALIVQAIGFHVSAESVFLARQSENIGLIGSALVSPLGIAAALGVVYSVARRNLLVLPMACWLVATVMMLMHLAPLFMHHLVALVGPLIGLAILPFAPDRAKMAEHRMLRLLRPVVLIAISAALFFGFIGEAHYFTQVANVEVYGSTGLEDRSAVADLLRRTRPSDRIVTDAQFLLANARRDTPPWLVDTTLVRVHAGQLSASELIEKSSEEEVKAVLFFGHRLSQLSPYHDWVAKHFKLEGTYGRGNELWLR